MTALLVLFSASRWIPVLPALIYLIKYRKLVNPLRLLGLQLALAGSTEIVSKVFTEKYQNNMPVYHVYVVLELIIFSVIFSKLIHRFITTRTIAIIAVAFVLFAIVNGIFFQTIYSLPSNLRVIESLVLVTYSITGFYKIFTEMKIIHLEKNYEFWIFTGVLLYFSGNFFLFILSSTILNLNINMHMLIWMGIHSAFNIILYLSLTVALLNGSGNKYLLHTIRGNNRHADAGSRHRDVRSDLPEEADPAPSKSAGA